ncbi:hypothetical protein HK105_205095 [Polyrhizophydium stewartii]|uniref:C2 domain-containing protein n=1 Tax=Polyrhizophydium stewartii TaxID=2732419 RepID=A0ABR4N705_9FUNG
MHSPLATKPLPAAQPLDAAAPTPDVLLTHTLRSLLAPLGGSNGSRALAAAPAGPASASALSGGGRQSLAPPPAQHRPSLSVLSPVLGPSRRTSSNTLATTATADSALSNGGSSSSAPSFMQALTKSLANQGGPGGAFSGVAPPLLPLSPAPQGVLLQCCDHLQRIFGMSADAFEDAVNSVLDVLMPDAVARDLEACHLLLTTRAASMLDPSDFGKPDDFESWRAGELVVVEKLVALTTGRPPSYLALGDPASLAAVALTVVEARGLLAKDKASGANNPYCVVEHAGRLFVSHAIEHTVDPRWVFQVPLILSPSADPVVVSIWNRPTGFGSRRSSQIGRPKEAFLGVCFLPASSLIAWSKSPSQQLQTIDLARRSSKSHVTGTLSIHVVPATAGPVRQKQPGAAVPSAFYALPPDTRRYFYEIYRLAAEHDIITAGGRELSEISRTILHDLSSSWRVGPVFRDMCAFDIFTKLYIRGFVPADVLYNEGFSKAYRYAVNVNATINVPELAIFRSSSTALSSQIEYQLGNFFNTIRPTADEPSSPGTRTPQVLETITVMVSAMQTCHLINDGNQEVDVTEYASNLLLQSLRARYHGLLGIAHAQSNKASSLPLIRLVQSIRDDLELYSRRFDMILFGRLHLPSLGAKTLYEPVAAQLEEFAKTYVAVSPDMSDVFDLYAAVRQLQVVCEKIDFRLADRFPMSSWFKSFVRQWLERSESKIREWVRNAIEVDECVRLSDTVLHSTSILDIFTSFQQQIDFVRSLDWPNEAESQLFFSRLLQEVCECISRYVVITKEKLLQEFSELRSKQPVKRRETTARIGKIKIKIKTPKLKSSKTPESQEVHYRFSSKTCVRLENVNSLFPRFEELVRTVPHPRGDQPRSSPTSEGNLFYGDPRYTVRVTIARGHRFTPMRPWNTRVSCRVSSSTGRELGRTSELVQSSNPQWDERVYAIMSEREVSGGLRFGLVHHVPGRSESLFAVGQLHVEGLRAVMDMDDGLETLIQLGSYGKLLVRVHVSRIEDTNFLVSMTEWVTSAALDGFVECFVDQICMDVRDRVHPITLKYKTQALTNFMNKSKLFQRGDDDSANSVDQDEVAADLAPFFDFLNANLEILTENVEEELAFRIIGRIWNRVVEIAEAMVVPSLGEDPKERKPWDSRRFQFFKLCIQNTESFFESDGEGLPATMIQTPAYRRLQFIIASYEMPRATLLETYEQYKQELLVQLRQQAPMHPAVQHQQENSRHVRDSTRAAQAAMGNGGSGGAPPQVQKIDMSDLDWLLKLLKMRGLKDFVDSELRERFNLA